MHVTSVRSVSASAAEALVVGAFTGRRPAPGADRVLRALGGWVDATLEAMGFTGEHGQSAVLPGAGQVPVTRVVVVGLGDDLDLEGLRRAAGTGRRAAEGARSLATTLHQVSLDGATGAVLEGLAMADYRFDAYRSGAGERAELSIELLSPPRGWGDQADRAEIVAGAVAFARDLVNEPPAGKGPGALAERMVAAATEAGLAHEVWEGERLVEERLGGLLGVGAGSHRGPALVRLDHRPPKPRARLALVGKGITFDSGGLSIKTSQGMQTMKTDMAGAAAVVAATVAIARLGLDVEVRTFAPLAENMPGGGAQRPGDVLRYRNGKTIEVLNTDAEGRLVLADALCLAAEWQPDLIVDVATLTGACKVALGDKIAGLWARPDTVGDRVAAAAEAAGERVWRMPLPPDYRSLIDSEIADMKNTAGRYGGAIGAALLLAEFVGEVAWAHLDIAGPARSDAAEHYLPKGGTGFGVRTLLEVAHSLDA